MIPKQKIEEGLFLSESVIVCLQGDMSLNDERSEGIRFRDPGKRTTNCEYVLSIIKLSRFDHQLNIDYVPQKEASLIWVKVRKMAKIRKRYNQSTTPGPGYHMGK